MKLRNKDIRLGKINGKVQKTLQKFEKKKIVIRIWEKDHTVWKKDGKYEELINNRLGWMSLPYAMTNNVYEISEFTREVIDEGFTEAVLLGMGGSSMGPEVISKVFSTAEGYLKLHVLDTTDPKSVQATAEKIDLSKTLFIVSSKSGTTIEVDSLFRYFYKLVIDSGRSEPGRQFAAITDKDTELQKAATENGFRKIFTNPSDIGGRYSVLSYFGLVPASLLGVDLIEFLKNAGEMMNMCSNLNPIENPGAFIGIITGIAALEGRDKLTFAYSDNLKSLGYWVEQLIAESTGKEKKGILPVEGEVFDKASAYSKDRTFVTTTLGKSDIIRKNAALLARKGFPVINIHLAGRYDVAGQFYLWEFATAVMGVLLGINPFDEPNVKESKDNTTAVLAEFEKTSSLPAEKPMIADEKISVSLSMGSKGKVKLKGKENLRISDLLGAFMMLKGKGDYFSLMAYIEGSRKNLKKLDKIRELLKKKTKSAVTVGLGPRFLHSTGQYHKGGPDKGMFIQFVTDDKPVISVPGKNYTFGILRNAQATGDFESLKRWNRRVMRVDLGSNAGEGLDQFIGYLKKALK